MVDWALNIVNIRIEVDLTLDGWLWKLEIVFGDC